MALRTHVIIARRLRRDGTDAERLLWRALRESALPWKFRRQHPIGHRIAGFAWPARRLVIELDGGQHAAQSHADANRSAELKAHGYRIVRFWNNELLENLDGILQRIGLELERSPISPQPSPPPGAERGRRA